MRVIILVLIFNLCIIGPVMADEDAFAPARSGKFLCGMPTISKTCAFTSFYEFGANNHLTETNEILISTEPKISAIVEISYQLENGKYCETATGEEFAKARIRYMARDLEDNIANPIRAKLSERIRKYQNKKICISFEKNGENITQAASVDGVINSDLNYTARWIGKDEGYQLGENK